MQILKSLLACLGAALFALLAPPSVAANLKAMDLLQQGYNECKSAHLLRRKDFVAAKESYAKFTDFKQQALTMAPELAGSTDADVTRIMSYCDTVGVDIGRTEALPVFQEGADACAAAAEHVRANQLDRARAEYQRYLQKKDEAIALSGAITEVFSVTSEIRRCDRVLTDIEAAQRQQSELAANLQQSIDHLQQTLGSCQAVAGASAEAKAAAEQGLSVAPLNQRIESLRTTISNTRDGLAQTPHRGLLDRSELQGDASVVRAKALLGEADACMRQLDAGINTERQNILLVEQKIQMQQELALQRAKELEIQQETPEQRQQRLHNNARYYSLIKRVNPEYPDAALRRNKSGYVVLEFSISTEGQVVDPVVVEAQPDDSFNEAAVNAVRQWQYQADFAGADVEPDIAIVRTKVNFALN